MIQATITNSCAVIFDENCCKASKTLFVIKKNQEGKLCGLISGLNPPSICQGPKLKDDVEVKIMSENYF